MLSPSLAPAACQTLGVPQVDDSFSMTEVIPVTGRTCSQAHLHHDLNTGLTELLDLETGEPAAPGALGTVVITPYFPYRDCMPVFRYDTRDVVRRLPDEPLSCELAGIPGTSQVLGKASHLLRLSAGRGDHAPAAGRRDRGAAHRAVAGPVPGRTPGRPGAAHPAGRRDRRVRRGRGPPAPRRSGLDVDLVIVGDDQAASLRHTRSDLRETTFVAPQALIGA